MTLEELIDRAVELGREEVCFNLTNEFPTRAVGRSRATGRASGA